MVRFTSANTSRLRTAPGTASTRFSEAFFGSLTKELITRQLCHSRDVATAAFADYIETFYNRSRLHSHLGGISPEQVEAAHKPGPRMSTESWVSTG